MVRVRRRTRQAERSFLTRLTQHRRQHHQQLLPVPYCIPDTAVDLLINTRFIVASSAGQNVLLYMFLVYTVYTCEQLCGTGMYELIAVFRDQQCKVVPVPVGTAVQCDTV